MGDDLSESRIVRAVAQEAARRITRKAIVDLRHMEEALAGDDSGLNTVWDAICVQVQAEESFHWDAYDQTVRDCVAGYVTKLPKYMQEAIWLQTEAGLDWDCEEPEDRAANPIRHDDIIEYLVREYVYAEADKWSNARIRKYIEGMG